MYYCGFHFKWFWNQISANKTFVDHRGNYFLFITSTLPPFSIFPLTKQFAAQSEDSDLPRKGCTLHLFTCNTDLRCTLCWNVDIKKSNSLSHHTLHFVIFSTAKRFCCSWHSKGFLSLSAEHCQKYIAKFLLPATSGALSLTRGGEHLFILRTADVD